MMDGGDRAGRRVPGHVLEPQRDLAVDLVGDDEVDVADVGEQPQHVAQIGALDVEIDRRAVVLRAGCAQIAIGVRREGREQDGEGERAADDPV